MNKLVVTFRSTHDAIASQHSLTEASVAFTVMPTPVEITSDCGIALLIDRDEHARASRRSTAAGSHGATLVRGRLELVARLKKTRVFAWAEQIRRGHRPEARVGMEQFPGLTIARGKRRASGSWTS